MNTSENSNEPLELTRRSLLQLATTAATVAGLSGAGPALRAEDVTPSITTASGAKLQYDLSTLKWQLSGYMPYMERLGGATSISDIHQTTDQKVGPIPASVPGSVQLALLNAGVIKDWNVGHNATGTAYRNAAMNRG